jgi:hypothetical protein
MFNVLIQEMQMECFLELRSNISLHPFDLEGQSRGRVVIELDRALLIAVWIKTQDPQVGAIINGGELVELFTSAAARNSIDELHIDLDLMTRKLHLIALMALGGRQAIEFELREVTARFQSR